ncbi:MAG: hypothetical protein ACRDHW_20325, partial [Ktedonobacteraceae bacterium]
LHWQAIYAADTPCESETIQPNRKSLKRGRVMTETKPTPNQKLRYERERRGWPQQDVADKIGTTPDEFQTCFPRKDTDPKMACLHFSPRICYT